MTLTPSYSVQRSELSVNFSELDTRQQRFFKPIPHLGKQPTSISPPVEKSGSEPNVLFATQTDISNGRRRLSTAYWASPHQSVICYKQHTTSNFLSMSTLTTAGCFVWLQENQGKSSRQRAAKELWCGDTHSRSTLSQGLNSFKWPKCGWVY